MEKECKDFFSHIHSANGKYGLILCWNKDFTYLISFCDPGGPVKIIPQVVFQSVFSSSISTLFHRCIDSWEWKPICKINRV